MFLFPAMDCSISITYFEKSPFLDRQSIFGWFGPQIPYFAPNATSVSCVKTHTFNQKFQFFENGFDILLNYSGSYFGPPGTIWSPRKWIFAQYWLRRAQNSHFWQIFNTCRIFYGRRIFYGSQKNFCDLGSSSRIPISNGLSISF